VTANGIAADKNERESASNQAGMTPPTAPRPPRSSLLAVSRARRSTARSGGRARLRPAEGANESVHSHHQHRPSQNQDRLGQSPIHAANGSAFRPSRANLTRDGRQPSCPGLIAEIAAITRPSFPPAVIGAPQVVKTLSRFLGCQLSIVVRSGNYAGLRKT
jgi:hypothetical protein